MRGGDGPPGTGGEGGARAGSGRARGGARPEGGTGAPGPGRELGVTGGGGGGGGGGAGEGHGERKREERGKGRRGGGEKGGKIDSFNSEAIGDLCGVSCELTYVFDGYTVSSFVGSTANFTGGSLRVYLGTGADDKDFSTQDPAAAPVGRRYRRSTSNGVLCGSPLKGRTQSGHGMPPEILSGVPVQMAVRHSLPETVRDCSTSI